MHNSGAGGNNRSQYGNNKYKSSGSRSGNNSADHTQLFSGPNVPLMDQQKKLPNQEEVSQYTINLIEKNAYPQVLEYLTKNRGITAAVLREYCVELQSLTFLTWITRSITMVVERIRNF